MGSTLKHVQLNKLSYLGLDKILVWATLSLGSPTTDQSITRVRKLPSSQATDFVWPTVSAIAQGPETTALEHPAKLRK